VSVNICRDSTTMRLLRVKCLLSFLLRHLLQVKIYSHSNSSLRNTEKIE
jgi:hypothetical protein